MTESAPLGQQSTLRLPSPKHFTVQRSTHSTAPNSEVRQGCGNASDRDQLVLDHLTLVKAIARKVHARLPRSVELEELISAGTLGLIQAAERFNPMSSTRFPTYAALRIRGSMLDMLRSSDVASRSVRRKKREITDVVDALTSRLRSTPDEEQIAAELGVHIQSLRKIMCRAEEGRTNYWRSDREDGSFEESEVAEIRICDPLLQLLQGELRAQLVEALDELPEKERLVLKLYYGEELTMREIGLTLGVVDSRISQIHNSAILRLRNSLMRSQNILISSASVQGHPARCVN